MRRTFLHLASLGGLATVSMVRPTHAIVGGEADGAQHPQVCAIVGNLNAPDGPIVERCTAVLVARDVAITQAHCADGLSFLFNQRLTCEADALNGTQRIPFTGVPHPDFRRIDGLVSFDAKRAAGVENHDRGVLILHEPIDGVKIAEVARPGFLDVLFADCAGADDCPEATLVAYGAQARGDPGLISSFTWRGRGARQELRGRLTAISAPYASSSFSTLPGDSGGVVFQAGTGQHGGGRVLGTMTGAGVLVRWDTDIAWAFLSQFIDLGDEAP